jgi:hypothetical protein
MKHRILRACGIILAAAIILVSTVAAQTACKVIYTITPQNSSAFGAAITIDNTGTTAWTSWTLTWTFANGQTITSLWDGTETQSGANVTVKNLSYNGSVAAGGNVVGIGFNSTWNGTTNAVPTSFAVNGVTCGALLTATTTALAASTITPTVGASVTLTATVAPTAATGTVTFYSGTTSLGTGTLSSGKATLATTFATAGTYSLTAVYAGSTIYATSTSSAVSIAVSAATKTATTTTLTASTTTPTVGASVTLTAAVAPTTATGTVTFYSGTTSLGTGTLSSGKATLATSFATAGSYSLTAVYAGSTTYATSTSSAVSVTVSVATKTATTTSLTASTTTPTVGASVTLTATVAPAAATGTVTFYSGATSLGTGTLASGVATLATSFAAAGTDSLTAVYGGSATYATSTSSAVSITVSSGTGTGFACSVLYTVSAQSPTTFGGAFVLGNTGTTAWTSWTLTWAFANGQTISSFWNGVETQSGANVSVGSESYNGAVAPGAFATNIGFDGIWNGVSNQIPISFSINGTVCSAPAQASGSFTLVPSPSSLAITQGGTGTDTITITDVSPFTSSLTLSAAGLPAGVTAVFGTNPATSTSVVTFSATSTATVGTSTVTITGTNATGTLVSSTPLAFTVKLPVPVISWLSPASGIAGSSVTIMPGGALGNASFGATQGTSAVYFGSTLATVTGWADNSVAVTVPSLAAGSVNVTVEVNGQTSAAVPFTITATAPSPVTYTGNSTWFSALGTPYGGCGVPQEYLDTQNFVALNVQNDPANYTLFLSRPISSTYSSEIGLWNNGANCGRWVHVTIGDFCEGMNDGMQDAAFCRGGVGWVADQFTGAELDLVVADSCQDGNAWCRDDPYHLDQAEAALNAYVLNGAVVGNMNPTYWNNRQINWNFELPPSYTGDINIGMLSNSNPAWTAISVTHLPNGIHGVQYLLNGVWTTAVMDGDMGEDFLISPTVAGGSQYEIQVFDITNTLINSARIYTFTYPASCGTLCVPAFTPVTYTISQ